MPKTFLFIVVVAYLVFFYAAYAAVEQPKNFWAECTNGKWIKTCKVTEYGIYIDGKTYSAHVVKAIKETTLGVKLIVDIK